ncbi:MAG: phosphatidylserine decarboxylase [candidate division KSB1 bacterium]|nr:phosphatidylserine decarboxylase [candidate division KSB1 bacterium]
MRIHREGWATLAGLAVFIMATGGFAWYFQLTPLLVLTAIVMVLFVFVIYFFRDPERRPPEGLQYVVSPADGKVVDVVDINEKEFFKESVTRISIFLSLFDVHVNCSPLCGQSGTSLKCKRGNFYPAQTERAAKCNVSLFTGLETEYGKLAFRQITGMLARRIVNYLKHDQRVDTGQKIGIIKFGSRVEVYLTDAFECRVQEGDRVRAGESIIAAVADRNHAR